LHSIVLPAETTFGNAMNILSHADSQKLQRTSQDHSGGPDSSRGAFAAQSAGESSTQSLSGLRLQKHADYQRAYAAGRKRQSASMSWFLAPRQPDGSEKLAAPRVGLTAGKVLGKAHERNRIKRRMREALRRHVDLLPQGCDLIFHPRRFILTIEFAKLEAEVVRILHQANAEAAKLIAASPVPGAVQVKPRT
jgi:ribonuclease P protein component